MWVVRKPFEFQLVREDSDSMCGKMVFNKGDIIMSFWREIRTFDNSTILVIEDCHYVPRSFRGVNFNIEDYVEKVDNDEQYMDRVLRDSVSTKTVHLQIRLLDTERDVNKFLMTIPRERIVDIKKTIPAPNDDRFMIIYT